jgi:hypothetical protein
MDPKGGSGGVSSSLPNYLPGRLSRPISEVGLHEAMPSNSKADNVA